jgi:tetratricopeptide (TPR) repeat protein
MPLPVGDPGDIQSGEIPALAAMLDSYTDRFGPCHPDTLAVVNKLAIAFWRAGDINRAIGLLDQGLDRLTSSLGREHPTRVDALSTLGAIMFEQRHLEQAGMILREVLECRIEHAGANHANSLAAMGDLAAVLFELGQDEEAGSLEREAFESARTHLGKTHPVTCVLAWHRTLSYERFRDPESARGLIVNELAWLLAEAPSGLEADQNIIRTMLAERLNWNAASAC